MVRWRPHLTEKPQDVGAAIHKVFLSLSMWTSLFVQDFALGQTRPDGIDQSAGWCITSSGCSSLVTSSGHRPIDLSDWLVFCAITGVLARIWPYLTLLILPVVPGSHEANHDRVYC
eukprot:6180288-Pleurochrysis_carterae.AAC.1